MKTYDYDYVIFIGRVEPPHNGHLITLNKALRLGQRVIVLLGTANSPRTPKNPFTASEREVMIRNSMSSVDNARVEFAGIEDRLYDHPAWLTNVRHTVNLIIEETRGYVLVASDVPRVAIIGHDKDESSKYITEFTEWLTVDVGSHTVGNKSKPLSSTMVRHLMFTGQLGFIESSVPPAVYTFIDNFTHTVEFDLLKEEYDHYIDEEAVYSTLPYWMNFYTADAVVFQSGHVLMVKRDRCPGKGLWALPGGHVEPTETPYEAALRELVQETQIKVPMGKLKGSVLFQESFSHPDRSLRCRITGPHGRTHTTAFCIFLDGTTSSGENIVKLPRVKAASDAREAKWFPISEILSRRDQIFEDHADIITFCLRNLPKKEVSNW